MEIPSYIIQTCLSIIIFDVEIFCHDFICDNTQENKLSHLVSWGNDLNS